jgi:hypothetical protein
MIHAARTRDVAGQKRGAFRVAQVDRVHKRDQRLGGRCVRRVDECSGRARHA